MALDPLPDDVTRVLELLESEGVAFAHWWDLARGYLAAGRPAQFVELLRSALDEGLLSSVTEFFGARPRFDIMQMRCGLAAYHIEQARAEQERGAKAQHAADAALFISKAKEEAPDEQLPCLAAGCLAAAKVRGRRRGRGGPGGGASLRCGAQQCSARAAAVLLLLRRALTATRQPPPPAAHQRKRHARAAGGGCGSSRRLLACLPPDHGPRSLRSPQRCVKGRAARRA